MQSVLQQIKHNPCSRRILLSGWNPSALHTMALPPCHVVYQFYVDPTKKTLSCLLYQRSSDYFLANNYNACGAAVLTSILAHVCNLSPGKLTHCMGDVHIYNTHMDQCQIQLQRSPKPFPRLQLNPTAKAMRRVEDFTYADFKLTNYHPHPGLKAPMAV